MFDATIKTDKIQNKKHFRQCAPLGAKKSEYLTWYFIFIQKWTKIGNKISKVMRYDWHEFFRRTYFGQLHSRGIRIKIEIYRECVCAIRTFFVLIFDLIYDFYFYVFADVYLFSNTHDLCIYCGLRCWCIDARRVRSGIIIKRTVVVNVNW